MAIFKVVCRPSAWSFPEKENGGAVQETRVNLWKFPCLNNKPWTHIFLALLPDVWSSILWKSLLYAFSKFTLHENKFFKGVSGTQFGSLELKIGSLESEKIYHRVPIIDNRVPTSPYRVPNTFLEKIAARKQTSKSEFSNLNSRTTETSSWKITAQQFCAMKDNSFHCW